MSSATALSNRAVRELFRQWGWEEDGGNGGHLIMVWPPTGKRVQITAPGRNTPTPLRALQKAARELKVSLHDFQLGPDMAARSEPPLVETGEGLRSLLSSMSDSDDIEHLDFEPPAVEEEPEEEEEPEVDLGKMTRLEQLTYLVRKRNLRRFGVSEVTELLDTAVHNANNVLRKGMDEQVFRRVRMGVYELNPDYKTREELEEAQRLLEEEAAREAAKSVFSRVGADRHGRVVLSDHVGDLWIAIRCEPGYQRFVRED